MFNYGDNHESDGKRSTKSHQEKQKRSSQRVLRAYTKADRLKRQDTEYGDLEDDDEDHLLSGSGHGLDTFDNTDLLPNEHGARLCKSTNLFNANISISICFMGNYF